MAELTQDHIEMVKTEIAQAEEASIKYAAIPELVSHYNRVVRACKLTQERFIKREHALSEKKRREAQRAAKNGTPSTTD